MCPKLPNHLLLLHHQQGNVIVDLLLANVVSQVVDDSLANGVGFLMAVVSDDLAQAIESVEVAGFV